MDITTRAVTWAQEFRVARGSVRKAGQCVRNAFYTHVLVQSPQQTCLMGLFVLSPTVQSSKSSLRVIK